MEPFPTHPLGDADPAPPETPQAFAAPSAERAAVVAGPVPSGSPAVSKDRLERRRDVWFVLVGVIVFLADQITKGMIDRLPDTADISVIPHLFRIIHVENPGVAFGLFQYASPLWRGGIIAASSLALLAVLVLLWRSRPSLGGGIAMSLIVGGACGNLFDRILHGKVVDFLLFYQGDHSWPAFNLADSAIVVGAIVLVWEILHEHPAPSVGTAVAADRRSPEPAALGPRSPEA